MTVNKIYFDPQESRRRHFDLEAPLRTQEGRTYELDEWLGRGGHGSVFSCIDRASGETFAIKFLLTRGTKPIKRFMREIRLLRTVDNEHVVSIHGTGRVRATEVRDRNRQRITIPFLLMDLAQGDLGGLFERTRPPRPESYMGQFRGLAGALAALHEVAIHRDIKPENILVQGEKWLLGDYGLCAFLSGRDEDLTGDRESVGPKYWMSPESHNRRIGHDDRICPASDVYQMAAVFWYVVTGRHPSGNLTRADWSGPASLFEPIHRALMHDVTLRPKDGAAFLREINDALAP